MAHVMDFVHDDEGSHRVVRGRQSVIADNIDDEDDELFAADPDEPDEDDGAPLPDEDDEPEPPEPDADDEEEAEPPPRTAKAPKPDVARLVREAQEHRDAFNRLQAEVATERLQKAQAELSAIKSHGALVARDYEAAKREYTEAIELGETAKLGDLQEKLDDLRFKMRQIGDFTRAREQQLANPQAVPQQAEAPKPNPLAMEWARKNKWFGNTANQRHAALTGAAYALDKVLIDQGYNPHDPGFYKELDKRLRETMNAGARPRRQTVAAVASRPAQTARRGLPRLTVKQKEMAHKLGVKESDYAQYVDM